MGVSVVPILTPACDFTKAVNDIFIFLVHLWLEKQWFWNSELLYFLKNEIIWVIFAVKLDMLNLS